MVRLVVMAAGQATRMGRDKLALPYIHTTVLGHVTQTVLEGIRLIQKPSQKASQKLSQELSQESSAGIKTPSESIQIRVVTRRPPEEYLTEEIQRSFREAGGNWLQVPEVIPLSETLRLGLRDLEETTQMVGFLPGDQVGVTSQELALCFEQALRVAPDFLVPISDAGVGSPVFFHRRYVSELSELQGEEGGRKVLYRYPERWTRCRVRETFLQDVDTPEEYQAWLEYCQRRDQTTIQT
ncbi:putative MobA-like protein [Desulfosporosinus acidiphilus SJ4]|uniref:Putative MobA-like protein n=1 Tax=Desulfosporosinus acidiphilus (strain DSM 22704 / JCM 16185 / SJ4) TaxID=646529 RepID=I4D5F8_DESAJ|nr:NTP transferase domain-containing protein [Desulfosporosinus acidiphilus]AFM41032.1 putative MobA-like protein [Desulfosporosinus acidiphilus SJ4]